MKDYTSTKTFRNLNYNFPIVIAYTISAGGSIDIQHKQGANWASAIGVQTASGAKEVNCFGYDIRVVVTGTASYSVPFLEALA